MTHQEKALATSLVRKFESASKEQREFFFGVARGMKIEQDSKRGQSCEKNTA